MSKFKNYLTEKEDDEVLAQDLLPLGKHNNTRSDVDKEQLKMGIKIEHEHVPVGTAPKIAKEIATRIVLDHLAEIPDYYTRLIKMEKEAGVS